MINEVINLKKYYPVLENDYYLTCYCVSNFKEIDLNRKRKTILILPGGGYEMCSDREAEPIALRLLGNDINAFVLKYQCNPVIYPHPLLEVYAAIAYIKSNADKYNVDINKIGVIGFSAGGNLACAASGHFQEEFYWKTLNVDPFMIKIDACLLGYPVITSNKPFFHEGSIKTVTNNNEKLIPYYSGEKIVTQSFPKTFIWHTTFDKAVSVKNTLLLADALATNNVFFELHIYPCGEHGQSLADYSVYNDFYQKEYLELISYNQQWIDNAIHFIKQYM